MSKRFRLADLFVVTGLIAAVAVPMTFGAVGRSRETASRIRCASNLRQIGQAIQLYANENRGAFPRTTFDATVAEGKNPVVWGTPYEGTKLGADDEKLVDPFGKVDKPEGKYRPAANDVTAPLYLLMRTQDIASDAFVCPSSGQTKFEFGGGTNHGGHWTNWAGVASLRESLSYSYANPYPTPAAFKAGYRLNSSISPDFAVASDMNPGGEAVTKVTAKSPAKDMRPANSLNHDRDGQNVLFGDGRVEFVQTPFAGVDRNNIFTAGSGDSAAVVGPPANEKDSVLLPSAADIGLKELPKRQESEIVDFTPTEFGKLLAKIEGKWERVRSPGDRGIGEPGDRLFVTLTREELRIDLPEGTFYGGKAEYKTDERNRVYLFVARHADEQHVLDLTFNDEGALVLRGLMGAAVSGQQTPYDGVWTRVKK